MERLKEVPTNIKDFVFGYMREMNKYALNIPDEIILIVVIYYYQHFVFDEKDCGVGLEFIDGNTVKKKVAGTAVYKTLYDLIQYIY